MKSRHVVGSRIWLLQMVWVMFAALASTVRASSDRAPTTMPAAAAVSHWNVMALQAAQTAGQGPIVQSRTMAIVQVAVHDALNAIDPRYGRYAFKADAPAGASVDAAIAAAARNALAGAIAVGALPFPQFGTPALQAVALAQVDGAYAAALAGIPDGLPKSDGIAVGTAAAAAIVALRSHDHATAFFVYTPGTRPGDWQPTPNPVPFDPPAAADRLPAALPGWGQVTPFVLRRSDQFEPDGPPRLSGKRYARDYNEMKAIGEKNSTTRSDEQSRIARFWYEGATAGWNRIARNVADARHLDAWDEARLLAIMNSAQADGAIASLEQTGEAHRGVRVQARPATARSRRRRRARTVRAT